MVWFTGLSGAGKTTLARALKARLQRAGHSVQLVDGDELREGLCRGLGFSAEDRRENIRRAAEVARMAADAGAVALVSLISPFRDAREAARARIGPARFLEVHVATTLERCAERDAKGFYRQARDGQVPLMTGVTSPYEPPVKPGLALDTGSLSVDESLARLEAALRVRGVSLAYDPEVDCVPSQPGITVVLPCLNEEDSIAEAIAWAKAGIADCGVEGEVLVVDNGSSDRSAELAAAAGARVVREGERGYGAALRRGFREAAYDTLVMGDADLTYDFRKLRELAEPVLKGEAELAIGNRMDNILPGSMPWLHRYIGNPVLSWLLGFMFHTKAVRDPHCGMRVLNRGAFERLGCVTNGMEFASEMVIRAVRADWRIVDRDIVYHPRAGESKLRSFRDGWRHVRFMMLHSPTMTLLLPGAILWLLGLGLALPLVSGPVMIGGRAVDIHFMIMAGMLNIVSGQLLLIGLLAKAYAHLTGLRDDSFIAWLYRHFHYEAVTAIAALALLAGLGAAAWVIATWAASGFSALNMARLLFFGMVLLVNGVMAAAGAYLFSIMALPRHAER